MTFHWSDPTTWFMVVYGAARIVSHFVPPHTIAGKAAAWILGHVNTATNTITADAPK